MNEILIAAFLLGAQSDIIISADDARSRAANPALKLIVSGECNEALVSTEIVNRGDIVRITVNGQSVEQTNDPRSRNLTQSSGAIDSARIWCSRKMWEIGYFAGNEMLFRKYGPLPKH